MNGPPDQDAFEGALDPLMGQRGLEALRVLVEAVPTVGGLLNALIAHIPAVRVGDAYRTLEGMLELADLAPDAVANLLAANPAALQLVGEALEASARTALDEKRSILAKLAAEALRDSTKVDEALFMVRTWDALEGLHVTALATISKYEAERTAGASPPDFYDRLTGSKAVAQAIVSELGRMGLVTDPIVDTATQSVMIRVTDYGRQILAQLEDDRVSEARLREPD